MPLPLTNMWRIVPLLSLIMLVACDSSSRDFQRVIWEFQTFNRRFYHGSCDGEKPFVSTDTVFIVAGYGWSDQLYLFALDKNSGVEKWRKGPFDFATITELRKNTIYFEARTKEKDSLERFTLSSLDGSVLPTNFQVDAKPIYSKVPGRLSSGVTWAGDIAVYGVIDSHTHPSKYFLVAFNSLDNSELWRAPQIVHNKPLIFNNSVYAGAGLGEQRIISRDLHTGRILWSLKSGGSGAYIDIFENTLYATAGYNFIAFSPNSGEVFWKFDAGDLLLEHTISDGMAYFASWNCKIYALKL